MASSSDTTSQSSRSRWNSEFLGSQRAPTNGEDRGVCTRVPQGSHPMLCQNHIPPSRPMILRHFYNSIRKPTSHHNPQSITNNQPELGNAPLAPAHLHQPTDNHWVGGLERVGEGWRGLERVGGLEGWRGGGLKGERGGPGGWCDVAMRWHAGSISAMLFSAVEIRFGDDTDSMSIYVLLQRPW